MSRTGIRPGTGCQTCAADPWRRLCRVHAGPFPLCTFCRGTGHRVLDNRFTRCTHLPERPS